MLLSSADIGLSTLVEYCRLLKKIRKRRGSSIDASFTHSSLKNFLCSKGSSI